MSREEEMVEITGHPRKHKSEAAYALWQGDMEEVVKDRATGEMMNREKWIFLPKSKCRILSEKNGLAMYMVPVWLAKEKGLI